MNSNEFYNVLMKDVDYILNGGFVVNTDAFMQTMSYASEQYEVLKQKINSFEEQIQELIEKYSVLSDKYNNISDLVVELRQQNTALQQERANMQATHQSTISQLQARIKELEFRLSISSSALDEYKQQVKSMEEPKTCVTCKMAEPLGEERIFCKAFDKLFKPNFECGWHTRKDTK